MTAGKDALRTRAEQRLRGYMGLSSDAELHELEVHRIELELQNEELRAARESVETVLARYREVFDFAPLGYAVFHRDAVIAEINLAGARLLAKNRKELLQRPFDMFVTPGARADFGQLLAAARASTIPVSAELELSHGRITIPVRITASLLRFEQPTVVIAYEDISERRAKEIELARTDQALRESNRHKDEFLAMLSHELRNPLTPIRASISILQLAEPGSEASREAIAVLDRSSAQLTRLIEDLLDVTRISRGQIELRPEPVELAVLIGDTLDDHAGAFADRGLTVERSIAGEHWVHGDPARLRQVVSNLLGNAVKFTPAGGRVHVTVDTGELGVRVRVCDTGIGIPPQLLDKLCVPFVQVPQNLDRPRSGLGLGLATAKRLLELHHGRITIHSDGIDRGTEVVFELPRRTRPSDCELAKHPRPSPRRVLIVEDHVDAAKALQQALTLAGHDVSVAYDGREALEVIDALTPEIVFCDLGLPEIDGYEVAQRLRSQPGRPYLVALSGYARPEDIARARAAGFDRHLAKPARREELDDVLATAPIEH